MRIQRLSYNIRGFQRITDYAVRWIRMVTDEAKKRVQILTFWKTYGLEATREAFSVSRSTLFAWQKVQRQGGSLEALNPKSRKPKNVRKRIWPEAITDEIKRLRTEHPNLGKDKIQPLLKRFAEKRKLPCPGIATIGNLVKDMGGLRTFPTKVRHDGSIVQKKREPKPRKPKDFIAERPGHCISLDTIERIIHGSRRYIVTFVDLHSRFAFAMATRSHASLAAKTFFDLIRIAFPYKLEFVLTDNGSEFMKHFDEELRRLCLTHWHTYPKSPKMNAHCERFNRTIQEEYVDYHAGELIDVHRFNEKLLDWLVWYNAERPHHAFQNKQSPLQFLLTKSAEESRMYLAHTETTPNPTFGL